MEEKTTAEAIANDRLTTTLQRNPSFFLFVDAVRNSDHQDASVVRKVQIFILKQELGSKRLLLNKLSIFLN
jgi:hypothetical protein